jgi:hypothetical protein
MHECYYYDIHNDLEWQNVWDIFFTVLHQDTQILFATLGV